MIKHIFEKTNYGYAVWMLPLGLFMFLFNPLFGVLAWCVYTIFLLYMIER